MTTNKAPKFQRYNEEIYDYCKDHYYHFECYPGEMVIYCDDAPDIELTLDEMLAVLTDEQKELIENQ